MVGVGTILADDLLLTCHLSDSKNPIRIICDFQLRTPLDARVIQTAEDAPTILATCSRDDTLARPYREAGCDMLVLPPKDGHVDLRKLMVVLGEKEIDSVLLEGAELVGIAKRCRQQGTGIRRPEAIWRHRREITGRGDGREKPGASIRACLTAGNAAG